MFWEKGDRGGNHQATRQVAPLLYDLTSLQREASNRFGFSARRTLQLAQALYEKHKALTYPRTDSRYLPNDYIATVKGTIRGFSDLTASKAGAFPVELRPFCDKILDEDWVRPNRRVFDTSKVSDHFAIIPTGQPPPKSLDEAEQKLYDMVLRRFLAVFFPAAEFDVTTRFSRIGEDVFKSDGKVLREAGWLEVYGKKAVDEQEGEGGGRVLVAVKPKEMADAKTVEMREESTKPPPRYNEATLLSSMEGAGKLVDDDELREAMSERGLGTPATRAAIIEGLIMDKYVERQGRELIVTTKGLDLVEQLSDLGAETLCSPELTGQWEYRLKLMDTGSSTAAASCGTSARWRQTSWTRAKPTQRQPKSVSCRTLSPPVLSAVPRPSRTRRSLWPAGQRTANCGFSKTWRGAI